jgi:hypothetical protein
MCRRGQVEVLPSERPGVLRASREEYGMADALMKRAPVTLNRCVQTIGNSTAAPNFSVNITIAHRKYSQPVYIPVGF